MSANRRCDEPTGAFILFSLYNNLIIVITTADEETKPVELS